MLGKTNHTPWRSAHSFAFALSMLFCGAALAQSEVAPVTQPATEKVNDTNSPAFHLKHSLLKLTSAVADINILPVNGGVSAGGPGVDFGSDLSLDSEAAHDSARNSDATALSLSGSESATAKKDRSVEFSQANGVWATDFPSASVTAGEGSGAAQTTAPVDFSSGKSGEHTELFADSPSDNNAAPEAASRFEPGLVPIPNITTPEPGVLSLTALSAVVATWFSRRFRKA